MLRLMNNTRPEEAVRFRHAGVHITTTSSEEIELSYGTGEEGIISAVTKVRNGGREIRVWWGGCVRMSRRASMWECEAWTECVAEAENSYIENGSLQIPDKR